MTCPCPSSCPRSAPALLALATWVLVSLGACAGPPKVSYQHETEVTSSGVSFQDLLEGTGRRAQPGRSLRIDYVAKLEDDTTVDSTYQRGRPVEFVMGDAPIAGWDEGLLEMRVGGVRKLVIPPALAYGEEGVPGLIPPNTPLVFQVELLAVEGE